jgi:hypothetical protein
LSERRTFGLITIVLIVLSYLSPGLFYWRWGGVPSIVQNYACPLCPYIDSTGSDLQKFTSRTIGMGTIKAAVLVGSLILFVGLPRLWSRHYKKAAHD